MTFYRKYRPRLIKELDMESVRERFQKIAENRQEIPHAFLFAGPRGTGKTSSARILAKLVNCQNPQETQDDDGVSYFEPCNECSQCKSIDQGSNIDVVEMDAASNRGIDDIRSLRESISLAPSASKKKFYIIDEAHMLTKEAANAFLKTLEEPPKHVVFVLATTDPEQLPETVLSRLVRIQFGRAKEEEIKRQIERINKETKAKVSDEDLSRIIRLADGSFRDAAKHFEDFVAGIGAEYISFDRKSELLKALCRKDLKSSLDILVQYASSNFPAKLLLQELLQTMRKVLYSINGLTEDEDFGFEKDMVVSFLEILLEAQSRAKNSFDSYIVLEVAFAKWCAQGQEDKTTVSPKKNIKKKKEKKEKKVSNGAVPAASASVINAESEFNELHWAKILDSLRQKSTSMEVLLRAARPLELHDNTLSIAVYYRFHKERLENMDVRRGIEKVCESVLGFGPIKINCMLKDKSEAPIERRPVLKQTQEENILKAAKEVFG